MDAKTQESNEIMVVVKQFLIKNLLEVDDVDVIDEETQLITDDFLDSVSLVVLVSFLEEQYEIEFKAHEINVDNFNRITDIARTVLDKLAVQS